MSLIPDSSGCGILNLEPWEADPQATTKTCSTFLFERLKTLEEKVQQLEKRMEESRKATE